MNSSISQEKEGGRVEKDEQKAYKKVVVVSVRYKECMKNHAAAMGGNATDGCGEFMPSGEEGSIEALKCSACNCHRNFHRKHFECDHHDHSPSDQCNHHHHYSPQLNNNNSINGILSHAAHYNYNHNHNHLVVGSSSQGYLASPSNTTEPPQQVLLSYKSGSVRSESDDNNKDDGSGDGVVERPTDHDVKIIRKRFRTKFTQEQKEKMFNFAEKASWRIQKLEESMVLQFCQEIGIKRRVLKIWMHNNKHALANKHSSSHDT
ncbi:hypothetical protein LWI28_012584 [Acer negundo]|uniref:ZF-HD dimerization-type domain-containing protein n=1 Tax=Acer negundo TaxID=4023 RepID=A0AAD5NKT4_ACENE|nr:hypothetical protein LWI28_012584 [Acer negundo]KAK4840451.1 hypothetical protein QYF36_009101 [Acer negundo]